MPIPRQEKGLHFAKKKFEKGKFARLDPMHKNVCPGDLEMNKSDLTGGGGQEKTRGVPIFVVDFEKKRGGE